MTTEQAYSKRPGAGAVLLQTAVPVAVGAFFHFKARVLAAEILYGVGALMLVSGFLVPSLFNRIERLGQAFGRVVATAITWGLLAPFFYLVFVPGRLILALRGLDPMGRQFPTDAPTYWVSRKPVSDPNYYKRQF